MYVCLDTETEQESMYHFQCICMNIDTTHNSDKIINEAPTCMFLEQQDIQQQ